MNKHSKAFANMIAAQTLAEAKNVSKYLRKNTSLSIDARNKIAESYFKKSLKEKFSTLYSEGDSAAPSIFETFITTITSWATDLFGALGSVLKVIVSGINKLYGVFFGSSTASASAAKSAVSPGFLNDVLGKIAGVDITGGQALFMAAVFGLMIWGIYKVCSWLKKKSQFSEAYIPMFSEHDENFLQRLVGKAKSSGGILSGMARKFAMMCVKRGEVAYKAARKYALDPMISKISPKYQQFMEIVGPKFVAMKEDVMTKVNQAGEWINGYNPLNLRAKLKKAGSYIEKKEKELAKVTANLKKSKDLNAALFKKRHEFKNAAKVNSGINSAPTVKS